MKSPFTGKEMKYVTEKRNWKFRGETFEYIHVSWLCEDTGEMFTTDDSDTAGYNQVTNQYRAKYGIPFTDEIIALRKRYNLSTARMSFILGMGTNQYRLYEQGEVPNISNGRMIRSAMNPTVMYELVKSMEHTMPAADYARIHVKVSNVYHQYKTDEQECYELKRIYGTIQRSTGNGYALPSLDRLKNMMLFILNKCRDVWCTKMNKLLFYADFLCYKETGMSISGLSYRAIEFGPVPENWDKIYSEFNEIRQELKQSGDFVGHILVAEQQPDVSLFTEYEVNVLDKVCTAFALKTAKELTLKSHEEKGWIENYHTRSRISFDYAFELSGI